MHTVVGTDDAKLGVLLDDLARSREPITITRDGRDAAVILRAEDYASIEETLHLLSSPANADRLRQALVDFTAGKLIAHDLCD